MYDLNGNIKTLVQNFNGALADSLTYTYKGNILLGVNDLVDNSASTNDFEDNGSKLTPIEGTTSTHEYLYDGNGNMIQDKNKNITVTYNFMNLPTKVNFGNGDSIVWNYTVSGAKLRKAVYDNGALITTVDYVNGVQYKNGKMDFFFTEQGRVKKLANGSLRYEYDIKDHLGNTRVSFADTNSDGNADILQEDHYYAFGLRIEGLSSSNKDNKFTYNGKELEDDHGLNWYHYGARYYDPQLGRWHAVDPGGEFYSSYLYVANNPIRLFDPDGYGSDETNQSLIIVGSDNASPEAAAQMQNFATHLNDDLYEGKATVITISTVKEISSKIVENNISNPKSIDLIFHGEPGAIYANKVKYNDGSGKILNIPVQKIDIDVVQRLLSNTDYIQISGPLKISIYACNSASTFLYKGIQKVDNGFAEQIFNLTVTKFGIVPTVTGYKGNIEVGTIDWFGNSGLSNDSKQKQITLPSK